MNNYPPLTSHPTLGQFRKIINDYCYYLKDEIGKGNSCTVFLGAHLTTNKKVAIKVIELKFVKDGQMRKLLETQLECIRSIRHPNLLRFLESYQTTNRMYIITEYCEGGDLQKQINLKRRFTQLQLSKFFSQFFPGYMSFAKAGYVHRDLKPSNMLIRKGRIKIADFGIVKKKTDPARDDYIIGTLVYMAPESIGSKITSQKSDIWSIGIMCYQLIHGYLPWKCISQNKEQMKIQIESCAITYNQQLMSSDCLDFLKRCLQKRPQHRIGLEDISKHSWVRKYAMIKKDQSISNQLILNKRIISRSIKVNERQKSEEMSRRSSSCNQSSKGNGQKRGLEKQKQGKLKFTYENQQRFVQNPEKKIQEEQTQFQRIRQKITKQSAFGLKQIPLKINKNMTIELQVNYYLSSILNYMKFLDGIIQLLSNKEYCMLNTKAKLNLLLIKQLKQSAQIINAAIKTGQNTLQVQNWGFFVGGQYWSTFVTDAQYLCTKYISKYIYVTPASHSSKKEYQQIFLSQLKQALKVVFVITKNALLIKSMDAIGFVKIAQSIVSIYNLKEALYIYKSKLMSSSPLSVKELLDEVNCIREQTYQSDWQTLLIKIEIILN